MAAKSEALFQCKIFIENISTLNHCKTMIRCTWPILVIIPCSSQGRQALNEPHFSRLPDVYICRRPRTIRGDPQTAGSLQQSVATSARDLDDVKFHRVEVDQLQIVKSLPDKVGLLGGD